MVEAEEFGEAESSSVDLTELSLSQLAMVKVVSASKKAEKLSERAAAAYVITQDDIRRSGATSIPEALLTNSWFLLTVEVSIRPCSQEYIGVYRIYF